MKYIEQDILNSIDIYSHNVHVNKIFWNVSINYSQRENKIAKNTKNEVEQKLIIICSSFFVLFRALFDRIFSCKKINKTVMLEGKDWLACQVQKFNRMWALSLNTGGVKL